MDAWNTLIFIFGWWDNCLMGISFGDKFIKIKNQPIFPSKKA